MAKNPAFPFYANDYLVDTLRWSRGMKSLHVDLLCESWANGKLKDDSGYPEGLNAEDKKIWTKIVHKWILVDGFWKNEKLEECRTARENFIKGQSEKGKKSAAVKRETQPNLNHGSTTVQPLEGEGEKEDEFKKQLKGVAEKIESIEDRLGSALDEIYIDQQRSKWKHVEFDIELMAFQEKVRGSPDHYKGHDTGGLRLAFQSQLRGAKKKSNGITSTKGTSRTTSAQISGSDYSAGL
jgi:hypothetical protein